MRGVFAKRVFLYLLEHGLPHDLAVKLHEADAANPGAIDWSALLMALLKGGIPLLIQLLESILGGLKTPAAAALLLLALLCGLASAQYPTPAVAPPAGASAGACACGAGCQCDRDDGCLCIQAAAPQSVTAVEALEYVNEIRAANGLAPYARDEKLTQAAARAAANRARRFLFGHTENDFSFLPAGAAADAAGCAAYPPDHGFLACAMFDDYSHGGAAFVMGADGKAYCHLFVRGGSGRHLGQRVSFRRPLRPAGDKPQAAKVPAVAAAPPVCAGPTCAAGACGTPAAAGACATCGSSSIAARVSVRFADRQPVRVLAGVLVRPVFFFRHQCR